MLFLKLLLLGQGALPPYFETDWTHTHTIVGPKLDTCTHLAALLLFCGISPGLLVYLHTLATPFTFTPHALPHKHSFLH